MFPALAWKGTDIGIGIEFFFVAVGRSCIAPIFVQKQPSDFDLSSGLLSHDFVSLVCIFVFFRVL